MAAMFGFPHWMMRECKAGLGMSRVSQAVGFKVLPGLHWVWMRLARESKMGSND